LDTEKIAWPQQRIETSKCCQARLAVTWRAALKSLMSIGFNTRIFGRANWQQPVKRSRNSDADSQKRKA
jgi:hypothetical protein